MDVISGLGRGVDDTVNATYEAYGNILRNPSNAAKIYSTPVKSYSYGPHSRHCLNLYEPKGSAYPAPTGRARPVLLYVYGGAFMFGDRVLREIPGDVVYHNVGAFFTELGFDVVVMDYRLVKHRAKYPSGGEDVDGVMKWMDGHFNSGSRDIFLLGHSAGGSHIATWMFDERFQQSIARFDDASARLRLRGAIFLSTPLTVAPSLEPLFEPYYGNITAVRNFQPTKLMQNGTKSTATGFELLILVGELDPDPVFYAAEDFKRSWEDTERKVAIRVLKGHNHHSPPISLGTNIPEEDSWGFMLGDWMRSRSIGINN